MKSGVERLFLISLFSAGAFVLVSFFLLLMCALSGKEPPLVAICLVAALPAIGTLTRLARKRVFTRTNPLFVAVFGMISSFPVCLINAIVSEFIVRDMSRHGVHSLTAVTLLIEFAPFLLITCLVGLRIIPERSVWDRFRSTAIQIGMTTLTLVLVGSVVSCDLPAHGLTYASGVYLLYSNGLTITLCVLLWRSRFSNALTSTADRLVDSAPSQMPY